MTDFKGNQRINESESETAPQLINPNATLSAKMFLDYSINVSFSRKI